MLDRTRHLLIQTFNDVKNIAKFFTIFVQVVYMAYLIYAFVVNSGLRAVNAVLFVLSLAYFIFYLIVSKTIDTSDEKDERKEARSKLKKARRFYQRSKILVNLFPLGVSIYSICLTSGNLNPFTLLSTVFMVFSWVLQILMQIIIAVVEKRIHLFEEALLADWDEMKEPFVKPIRETGNFIKKVFGKEETPPPPEKTPSKALQKIDKKIADEKAEKREAKRQATEQKRAQRQTDLERKKQERISRKKEDELFRAEKRNSDGVQALPDTKENDHTDGAGTR